MNNLPNNLDRPHNISTNGKRYVLEDNDILQNIPASQTRNVFKYIDKKEFMAVSGLGRMDIMKITLLDNVMTNSLFINLVVIR